MIHSIVAKYLNNLSTLQKFMDRRDFLRKIALTTIGLTTSSAMLIKEPLKYPLKSTADLGTTLDENKAYQARQVAKYIIENNNHPDLINYTLNKGDQDKYQEVRVEMNIENDNYVILVTNANEDVETEINDSMSMWIHPKDEHRKSKNTISISDEGLDGRCDFGIIPKNLSKTGKTQTYVAKRKEYPQGDDPKMGISVQEIYSSSLDKLISFYNR